MNKIKGFEADNLAGLDPANKARWVLDGDINPPKDFKCKVCTKTHAKFKCEYKCKHCKRKGSHLSENCFFKNKKEADPEKEKNKRDRSSRRGDQRRQRKKGISPKPTRGRARCTHSSQSLRLQTGIQPVQRKRTIQQKMTNPTNQGVSKTEQEDSK